MDAKELKALIISDIDAHRQQLGKLSLRIHSNPEVAFQEFKAAAWLTEYLEKKDFFIERGICDLPTAFRASYGQGNPSIAILAEYDALPEVGHACGHNLIATSAVGAAVAAKFAIDRFGGRVLVIGTPGEELQGGKILMARQGAFAGLDMAMMTHPAGVNTTVIQTLACQTLEVEFFGQAAHAAARPEEGINALEAILQSFTAINSLRQHIKSTARIHGIITDGGAVSNVVPAHSAGSFVVRADSDQYLDELKERVLNCFIGAATASGARLEYKWDDVSYASMRNNMILARLFRRNMQALGRKTHLADPRGGGFSTDMGNVSQLVPGIHPMVAIAPAGVLIHSPEFVEAAISEMGTRGLLDAAKAMAMTVVDVLSNPEIVIKIKEEFKRTQ